MKVGFVQFRPVFGDVKGNLDTMLSLLTGIDADLIVLPELANTGYAFTSKEELQAIAEQFDDSRSLDALRLYAKENSCSLVVGFAEKAGHCMYNSAALLRPDGSRELYRKIHLFGAERLFFQPGNIPFTVHDIGGVKIGIMICFDWFFPESARVLALAGAQIICHPVNFVLPWGQRAMAITSVQNRVFTITANRYGTESRGEYSFTFTGESQVTNLNGEIIAQAPKDRDSVVVVEIDPREAVNKKLNKYNDVFEMRRPEFYEEILHRKH